MIRGHRHAHEDLLNHCTNVSTPMGSNWVHGWWNGMNMNGGTTMRLDRLRKFAAGASHYFMDEIQKEVGGLIAEWDKASLYQALLEHDRDEDITAAQNADKACKEALSSAARYARETKHFREALEATQDKLDAALSRLAMTEERLEAAESDNRVARGGLVLQRQRNAALEHELAEKTTTGEKVAEGLRKWIREYGNWLTCFQSSFLVGFANSLDGRKAENTKTVQKLGTYFVLRRCDSPDRYYTSPHHIDSTGLYNAKTFDTRAHAGLEGCGGLYEIVEIVRST